MDELQALDKNCRERQAPKVMDEKLYVQKLIDSHWAYVEDLLETEGKDIEYIERVGFHYRSAMGHGFKHGVEWKGGGE